MRNRVVKQLLMVCMATVLSVSMPMMSWAADDKEEAVDTSKGEYNDDIIDITKDSIDTVIYDENNVKVTVKEMVHEQNGGRPFFNLKVLLENNSSADVTMTMFDSYVDDCSVGNTTGNNTVKAGKKGICEFGLWEEEYNQYGLDNFDLWEATVQIYDSNETLLEKKINIHESAFSSESSGANLGKEIEPQSMEDSNKDEVVISKDKADSVFYKDDKLSIVFENGEYTTGASDLVLTLDIDNKYPNIVTLNFKDAKVDDSSIAFDGDTNDYKAGSAWSSNWYIMLDKLQAINCTDFKKLSFTMTGTLNDGTELFEKNVIIDRDILKSLEGENTGDVTSDGQDLTENTVEETQPDEKEQEEVATATPKPTATPTPEPTATPTPEPTATPTPEPTATPTPEPTATPTPEPTATPTPEPTATPTPEPTATPEPESSALEVDAKTIKSIQSILNAWGYNCGTPDGVMGKNTTEAIKQLQRDQEMAETGEISMDLIDLMLSGIPYTTVNMRYNEAVNFWNSVSSSTGASYLTEADFNTSEVDYCMNNNMKIKIFGSEDSGNMAHGFAISSDGSFDVSTAVVEMYSIVYAMDLDVESPVKVQELVGNILDEASYEDGGIKFINTSIEGKKLSVMGLYNAD